MTGLYWFIVALMVVGVFGAFVPGIPGAILIVLGIIIWGIVHGFAGLWVPLIVSLLVFVASIGVDFLAAYLGAQQAGASKWGQIGAIVGLVLGIVGLLPALPVGGPILGLIVGALLGAIVGEMLYHRDWQRALKAAVGVVVGSLVGKIVEGSLALVAMIVFLVYTWGQAGV